MIANEDINIDICLEECFLKDCYVIFLFGKRYISNHIFDYVFVYLFTNENETVPLSCLSQLQNVFLRRGRRRNGSHRWARSVCYRNCSCIAFGIRSDTGGFWNICSRILIGRCMTFRDLEEHSSAGILTI